MAEAGADPAARIRRGVELATCEPPSAPSAQRLEALYREALQHFQAQADEAAKLGGDPEEAAWITVASTVLNLDRVLTKS